MPSKTKFYGDGEERSISADLVLQARYKRVQAITATVGGLRVQLSNARNFRNGGPQFYVINAGSNTFTLVNNALTTLATLAAGEVAEVWLSNNTTSGGTWHVTKSTTGSAPNPLPSAYHYTMCGDYGPSNGPNSTTVEFNQQLNVVTVKTSAPTATDDAASFKYGATGHITGGGTTGSTQNDEYDPDAWVSSTAIPDTFKDHAGTHSGVDGYIFGGRSTAGTTSTYTTRTSRFSAGAWTTMTVRPNETYRTSAVTANVDGKIYLMGGRYSIETSANKIDKYDADTWVAKTSRPFPIFAYNGSASTASYVYSFCGRYGSGTTTFDNVWRYDPVLDAWAVRTAFVNGNGYEMMASSVNDVIHVIGGYEGDAGSPVSSKKIREYVESSDSYVQKTPLAEFLVDALNHSQGITR